VVDLMGQGRAWHGSPWNTVMVHLGIGAVPALVVAAFLFDGGIPVVGVIGAFVGVTVLVAGGIAAAGDATTRKEWPAGAAMEEIARCCAASSAFPRSSRARSRSGCGWK
jgi:hypothetical protein